MGERPPNQASAPEVRNNRKTARSRAKTLFCFYWQISFSRPDKMSLKRLESNDVTWIKMNTPAHRDCGSFNFYHAVRGICVSGDE